MNDVHDLRTRSRRVEAIAGMLIPGHQKSRRHLLKVLKPLRKAAGKVRDMDVLAAKARTLAGRCRNDFGARLLGHLEAMRVDSARKLMETISARRNDIRDSLKRFSRQIEDRFHSKQSSAATKTRGRKPHTDAAIRLMDELSHWPAFNEENLHAFRIKVKELRYILQLTEDSDLRFVQALEKVKELIGNWHDWQELRRIAAEVLDPKKNRPVFHEIEEIGSRKFKQAQKAAHAMRARYLGAYRGFTVTEP